MHKMLEINKDYEQIIYTDEQVKDFVNSNFSVKSLNLLIS